MKLTETCEVPDGCTEDCSCYSTCVKLPETCAEFNMMARGCAACDAARMMLIMSSDDRCGIAAVALSAECSSRTRPLAASEQTGNSSRFEASGKQAGRQKGVQKSVCVRRRVRTPKFAQKKRAPTGSPRPRDAAARRPQLDVVRRLWARLPPNHQAAAAFVSAGRPSWLPGARPTCRATRRASRRPS